MSFSFDINSAINQRTQGFDALGELGRFMLQKRQSAAQLALQKEQESRLKGQQDYQRQQEDAARKRLDARNAALSGALFKDLETPEFETRGVFETVGEDVMTPDIAALMQMQDVRGLDGKPLVDSRGLSQPLYGPFMQEYKAQAAQDMSSRSLNSVMTGTPDPEPSPALDRMDWSLPKSPTDAKRARSVKTGTEVVQTGTKTERVPNENWMADGARAVAGVDPELAIQLNQGAKIEQGTKKAAQVESATEAVNNAMNAMYQPMREGATPEEVKTETDRRFVGYVTEMNKYNALTGKPLVDVNNYEMQKQKQDIWRYQVDNNLEMAKQKGAYQKEKDASDNALKERELKLKEDEFKHEKAMDWNSLGLEKQKLEAARATGKFNDGQLNSAAFAVRMSNAIPVIVDNEEKLSGDDRTLLAFGKSPMSETGRLYYNALRDVAMAQLRKESGAAISEGEMKLMFERYGRGLFDGDSVRSQKIDAIKTDFENMKSLSNGAYEFITSKQSGQGSPPNGPGGDKKRTLVVMDVDM